MDNLAFPQSFHAMRSRFGTPAYTKGNSEWFERSNGQFIVVNYDGDRDYSDGKASNRDGDGVGYSTKEENEIFYEINRRTDITILGKDDPK